MAILLSVPPDFLSFRDIRTSLCNMILILEKESVYRWITTGVKFIVKDDKIIPCIGRIYLIKFLNSRYQFKKLIAISHAFIVQHQHQLVKSVSIHEYTD